MSQSKLRAVPCSIARAKEIVDAWHRHHGSSTSALFAAAVADDEGVVRGVALIGRPVARLLDDGFTLEITRVATDGYTERLQRPLRNRPTDRSRSGLRAPRHLHARRRTRLESSSGRLARRRTYQGSQLEHAWTPAYRQDGDHSAP
jgi:hypothetical protein